MNKYFFHLCFCHTEILAYRYTAEEAFELIMNDELEEMESCDSFDTDDFSDDTTSSCPELDSDLDQAFCGRTISVAAFLILILNQEDVLVQEVEIPDIPEKDLESKL